MNHMPPINRHNWMKFVVAKALGVGKHPLDFGWLTPVTAYVDGWGYDDEGTPGAEVEFVHPDIEGISLDDICWEVRRLTKQEFDFPEATPEEYEAIKASIARYGVHQPVVVDEQGDLIAGRLRKRACDELGIIACPTISIGNLTTEQKRQLAFELDYCRKHVTRDSKKSVARLLLTQAPSTSDRDVGRASGLDHKTAGVIRREMEAGGEIPQLEVRQGKDGKRYKIPMVIASTPKQLETALASIKNLPDVAAGQVMDTITAGRRARRNRKKQQLQRRLVQPLASDSIKIFHCRFQELEERAQITPSSVPLILTDIPYDNGFLEQLPSLAEMASRVLVEGGLFVTYSGIGYLNRVMRILEDSDLNYRWMLGSFWEGNATMYYPCNAANRWLPVLVYSKGPWRQRTRWGDVLRGSEREKSWHEWQRPISEIESLVTAFSEPGEMVIDPCGGGFTTASACFRLKRRCVSCDVDEVAVQRGLERLAAEKEQAND